MKLWEKGIDTNRQIEAFTVGKDRELDLLLAPYDVLGSIAHGLMLVSAGLLTSSENRSIRQCLISVYNDIETGKFVIEPEIEDVHTQIEAILIRNLGETGKKIHTARSRNDQVLTDIKLFARDNLEEIVTRTLRLFNLLIDRSDQFGHLLMPGYTHMQVAMPSSFGLWFGAYGECLTDDMQCLLTAWKINDQNPLGSAAGYGSSFPVDRSLTTRLLGFGGLHHNSVYAQMNRGRTELVVAQSLGMIAATLARLANDVCLFSSQNFGFFSLPDSFTTGSSIMPHKKNPDVFELIRARCNRIQSLPAEISLMLGNLPLGYFRDLQILKESYLPVFSELTGCLDIAILALGELRPTEGLLSDKKYELLFSVDEVNRLVMDGVPFRDAYRIVADNIANGTFLPGPPMTHTHEGSIGNLCNRSVRDKMRQISEQFDFNRKKSAFQSLLTPNGS